jgi:hypothetical protein
MDSRSHFQSSTLATLLLLRTCGPPLEACDLLVIIRYHSVERPGSFRTAHFVPYSSRRYISSSKRSGTQSRVSESSVRCPSKAVPITNPPHELQLYEHSTRFTGRVISRLILPSLYKLTFNQSGSPNCLHSVTFDIDGAFPIPTPSRFLLIRETYLP